MSLDLSVEENAGMTGWLHYLYSKIWLNSKWI